MTDWWNLEDPPNLFHLQTLMSQTIAERSLINYLSSDSSLLQHNNFQMDFNKWFA